MGPEFFQTMMGRKFYERDLPRLIAAMENWNEQMERWIEQSDRLIEANEKLIQQLRKGEVNND